jgi:hypothetical protein
MLKRTTWRAYKNAAWPWILKENATDHIITLKNGREVFGFSAEDPDSIRNVTASGFWVDEGREVNNFSGLWDILLGRVLSSGGKGIVTTSPNGFDGIHEVFVDKKEKDYLLLQFPTYLNEYIPADAIKDLERKYDPKFARQEIHGEFIIFEGQVYYTFDRNKNASDLALEVAVYNPDLPICLCCDFNVDPMAWVIAQVKDNLSTGLREAYFVDEIFMRNSNIYECCEEFKRRYPNHNSGMFLYGDATGNARNQQSNVTNWKIIQEELARYNIISKRVPPKNPAERDRVNAVNAMLCNSHGERRLLINPAKCPKLIRDFEQVSYKEGAVLINKNKDLLLSHVSDAAGYFIEKEFSLNFMPIQGLRV